MKTIRLSDGQKGSAGILLAFIIGATLLMPSEPTQVTTENKTTTTTTVTTPLPVDTPRLYDGNLTDKVKRHGFHHPDLVLDLRFENDTPTTTLKLIGGKAPSTCRGQGDGDRRTPTTQATTTSTITTSTTTQTTTTTTMFAVPEFPWL